MQSSRETKSHNEFLNVLDRSIPTNERFDPADLRLSASGKIDTGSTVHPFGVLSFSSKSHVMEGNTSSEGLAAVNNASKSNLFSLTLTAAFSVRRRLVALSRACVAGPSLTALLDDPMALHILTLRFARKC